MRGSEEKEKKITTGTGNSGTYALLLVSLVLLVLGGLMNWGPEISPGYIFMALCSAFVITGIIGIVRYFMNDEFRRLDSYGFSAGCMMVILGVCGFVRVEEVSGYFVTIIGLTVIATGVVALQSALDLSRMKDVLWIPVLILAVVMTAAGVFVLMNTALDETVMNWIMLLDGGASLLILLYLAIRLHFYNKEAEKLGDVPRVVIFDMDGTLIDTEKIYRKVWPETFSEFGYEMTDEDFLALRSMGRPYSLEYIEEHFGKGAREDYDRMRERRGELFNAYIAEHPIEPRPYAAETLDRLRKKGYRLALATATDEKRTEDYLTKTDLKKYFDKLICATEVKRGKPAPDVYLEACSRMGVKPEEACAVEDNPNGLRSAHDAGMKVLFVPDLTGETDETGEYSDKTFKDLKELGDYLCR